LILHAIFASVSEPVLSFIATFSTTCGVWLKLQQLYANHSRTRAMQLKKELTLIQLGTQLVSKYLNNIKRLVDELVVVDSPISINNVTLYIFNGIGADFCDIATTIRACETSLTFEELLSKHPSLYHDNIGATELSLNPVMHSRMKHITIDLYFVRDLVSKGVLKAPILVLMTYRFSN